ncbi:MAG: hypothetical protein U5L09_03185 [Bacteroidales bacterium]|nr:hypothetical protein [Bacteroidales bacterium]
MKFFQREGIGLSQKNRVYEGAVLICTTACTRCSTLPDGRKKYCCVALADREVFTIELVRHLNEMHDSIPDVTLFGMSEWRKYDLETSYLMNLDVASLTIVGVCQARVRLVCAEIQGAICYRAMQKERYAFQDYDVAYYFVCHVSLWRRFLPVAEI